MRVIQKVVVCFHQLQQLVQNRTYLYYSTDPSVEVDWFGSRMDVVEGNEPTPQEMLDSPHDCINCLKRVVELIFYQGGMHSN